MKQFASWLLSGAGGIALLWTIIKFFVERKDTSAARSVATTTVPYQVEQVGLKSFEDRLNALSRMQDEEREYNAGIVTGLRAEVRECRDRITNLERQGRDDANWKRKATEYIRVLRATINQHLPEHPAPPVPVGLDIEE